MPASLSKNRSAWHGACTITFARGQCVAVVLWFRAFNRGSASEVYGVLRLGDSPHPDPNSPTRLNETALGIDPPCVYAYLGFTLEDFGRCAVALQFERFEGFVSPFDTGGLVSHIAPLNSWAVGERRAFLAEYSWEHSELPRLLQAFPGTSVGGYLDGVRPLGDGFHVVCPGIREVPVWRDNTDRRAWTWEGRRPTGLPFGDAIVAWTCPPDQYSSILTDPSYRGDPAFLAQLARRYVRGGVTALVRSLRTNQETQ